MLKVYMSGLIYFNGCDEDEQRAFAPDARSDDPPHYASLWIETARVNEEATAWWDGSRIDHLLDGVPVSEFRVPEGHTADLWFPAGGGEVHCDNLDDHLPKLKQREKSKDDEEVDFVVSANRKTVAEVLVDGGAIRGALYEKIGAVEWTIPNPVSLQITAVLKQGASRTRTITLAPPADGDCEVVFANMHEIADDAKRDHSADKDHIQFFSHLNPDAHVTLSAKKRKKDVGPLNTNHGLYRFLDAVGYSDGETPPCCPRIVHGQ